MSRGFSPAQKNKTDEACIVPTTEDIAWAAGFLEGEGAFQCDSRGALLTHASQKHSIDPLLKLHRLFGGGLCFSPSTHCLTWFACGTRALSVLKRVLPLMGSRRKAQIERAIDKYNMVRGDKPVRLFQEPKPIESLQTLLGITEEQEKLLRSLVSERISPQ